MMVIPSLLTGGSERVFTHLARHISRDTFDITVVILNGVGPLIKDLPQDVDIRILNVRRTAFSIFKLFFLIKRSKPDIVFTTLMHLNLIISIIKLFSPVPIKFIARESNTLSVSLQDEPNPFISKLLLNSLYRKLDCIICQCQEMKNDLIKNFKVPAKICKVINNPVDVSQLDSPAEDHPSKWNNEGWALISVGRMRRQKGYDRIITALSQCTIPYNYLIIGDGERRSELEGLITKFGLSDKIKLMTSIPKPYGYLAQADCLLLGSYYEGFPNVVIEANALGIPVIAWASPGGHNEIIENGVNGWIIHSEKEMCNLITSKSYLQLDRQAIRERAREKYDLKNIIDQYQKAFIDTLLNAQE